MTIVVRVIQGLLILTALGFGVTAVVLAGTAHDDVGSHCYMIEVQGSNDRVPHESCAINSVKQTQAISAAAIGLAGIGTMIGAVAMNGMVPRGGATRKTAAGANPYGYAPQPGYPQQPHQQGPHSGPMQTPYGPPPGV